MATGIIAEYNPFHAGHAYHIAETKERTGGAPVVVVMSGNMVQRGELAAFPKHVRAEAALRGGADLVVELPVPWALSSAERFAMGGVALLVAMGCDHISFGSETGDAAAIRRVAAALATDEADREIRRAVREGVSYALARQLAAESLAGDEAELLQRPNDLLAAEYLRVLLRANVAVTPVAIKRWGAEHDAAAVGEGFASASALRERLALGESIDAFVPYHAAALYRRAFAAGTASPDPERTEAMLLGIFRHLPDIGWLKLPGGTEGFGLRLMQAARKAPTLEMLYRLAQTKRYPQARVRRMALWAALGMQNGDADGTPPYIRVLGANETGRALLRQGNMLLPVLTKPAHVHDLGPRAERVFRLEATATDLYNLSLGDPAHRGGDQEWRTSPVML